MSDEVHSVLPSSRRQCEETDSGNVRESPQIDVGDLNMPLLFCRAGVVVVKRLRGKLIFENTPLSEWAKYERISVSRSTVPS